MLYDAVKTKYFTLAPYVTLGSHKTEIYLDYKFEDGVVPTSLKINANENNINFGVKAYFRVGAWQSDHLELFVNADAYYQQGYSKTWRFDNRRIDPKGFSLSNVAVLTGVTLRYSL